jgi:probable rRNA maturation factor
MIRRPFANSKRKAGGDGRPEVFIADEQSSHPVELDRWRELVLNSLMEEGVRGNCELSVFFIDEDSIAELNAEHMGKIGPTDVLSFPMDAVDAVVGDAQGPGMLTKGPSRPQSDVDDAPLILGDILLCPAVAARQAPDHAGTYNDEVALLLVHGVLHILGHDHFDEPTTTAMRSRELALLTKFHWNGPAPDVFRQDQE